jgi:uncharacterized protein YegL
VFEKDAPRLSCPCGHEGNHFTKINLVLNDSVITIEGKNGIVTEKALSLFVCPVCGTVKALLPSRLNGVGAPTDESRPENTAAEEPNAGASWLVAERAIAKAARLTVEKARNAVERAAREAAKAERDRVDVEKAAEAARPSAENAAAVSSPPSFNERNVCLFFMIDTSGSMDGEKIGAVNCAFDELTFVVKEMVEEHPGLCIKIAALEFSTGARWITGDGPLPVEQFQWKHIEAGGITDVGAAFKLLNKTLSAETFPGDESGKTEIVLLLLTDGTPTDDWQNELEELKRNNRFTASRKFGIAIGDDADIDMLKEFTGSVESVLETYSLALIKKLVMENTNDSSTHEYNGGDNVSEDDTIW